jgi:hypothetical protein
MQYNLIIFISFLLLFWEPLPSSYPPNLMFSLSKKLKQQNPNPKPQKTETNLCCPGVWLTRTVAFIEGKWLLLSQEVPIVTHSLLGVETSAFSSILEFFFLAWVCAGLCITDVYCHSLCKSICVSALLYMVNTVSLTFQSFLFLFCINPWTLKGSISIYVIYILLYLNDTSVVYKFATCFDHFYLPWTPPRHIFSFFLPHPALCLKNFFLDFFNFLLDIFFIYISNAIPKVPYILPLPCFLTHSLPLLGPGVPLYWGIKSLQDQGASLPNDGRLGHPLLHMQLESRALGVLVSSYCCSTYRVADPFSSLGTFSSPPLGALCTIQ